MASPHKDSLSDLSDEVSTEDLRAILEFQRASFIAEGIPSLDTRLARVDRLAACILESAEEISEALSADFGRRSDAANFASDIAGTIGTVAAIRANLAEWVLDRQLPSQPDAELTAELQVRPKGVVGVIGPWNFPVGLVVTPALEALAAGNRVMIKASEIPHRTASVLARAISSRMSPAEVVVITGGPATAASFASLQFDHLFFTGSPKVGGYVAAAAGANLVPVTLELGGKNPVVISADADLEAAAVRITTGRLVNGGQVCLCPDYVFVPRQSIDAFVDHVAHAIRDNYETYHDNPGVISVINGANFDRVMHLIDDARTRGAKVVTVAPESEQSTLPDRGARIIAPTILTDVTPDMAVEDEEIFGPVLVIHPYDTTSEVIDYINSKPSPLAAYWFGSDGSDYRQFLARTTSGGVTRNDVMAHWSVEGAPGGGIGRSGMGAYHGKTGFDTFSHYRTVASSQAPAGVGESMSPNATAVSGGPLREYLNHTLSEILSRLGS